MRCRLRDIVVVVVCGACLLTALAAGGVWAFGAYMRSFEPPEYRLANQLAPRLTPQAQSDDEGATALTAEAVVAALEDAGFWCCAAGTNACPTRSELPAPLGDALQHYACYAKAVDTGGRQWLLMLSYKDSGEAQRAAVEENLANRSVDTMPCALSRGRIVLVVSSDDLEFVSKLRAMLDRVH